MKSIWNLIVVHAVAALLALSTGRPALGDTEPTGVPANLPKSTWAAADVHADYVSPDGRSVEQGGAIGLTIDVGVQAHIAVALIDALGHVVVVAPQQRDGVADPGTIMVFPDPDLKESLSAAMAPGAGKVLVIASPSPLFGLDSAVNGPHTVQSLVEALKGAPVALRYLELWVKETRPREFLTVEEIVDFFTNRTRGLKNAALGLRVGFDTDSANLDGMGRRQLESLGRGLDDPELAGKRFVLEGYTDDRGTDGHNYVLSEHRAQSVRDYLTKQMGVDPRRLETKGFGKSSPYMPGTSDEARRLNRRVVIRRADD